MRDMFNRSSVLWSIALLGLLAVGGFVLIQGFSPGQEERSEPTASPSEESIEAPDFALERLNGETFRLSEHRGTVVAINFWATWCPPCREEIPEFVELQEEMKGEMLFVGVSLDKGPPAEVRSFAEEFGINYPIVIDDGTAVEKYGPIAGIPTTFLVGPEGTVRLQAMGQLTKESLRPVLQALAEGEELGKVGPPFKPVDRPLGKER